MHTNARLRREFATLRDVEIRQKPPWVGLHPLTRQLTTEPRRLGPHDLLLFDAGHEPGRPVLHPDALGRRFRHRWAALYPELDFPKRVWRNVVAAGGAVLRAIRPLPPQTEAERLRTHSADVDLFLYGLGAAGAEAKIREIVRHVREHRGGAEPQILRTHRALTIFSEWPHPHIQIILRLYRIPAEVPLGFDVDCCACVFDGQRVRIEPRVAYALAHGSNRADDSRLSPQYEWRLRKYARRGFAVHVPLARPIDAAKTLAAHGRGAAGGLARLLAMERRERGAPHDRLRRAGPGVARALAQLAACALILWLGLGLLADVAAFVGGAAAAAAAVAAVAARPRRVHWKYHAGASGGAAPGRGGGCAPTVYEACLRAVRGRAVRDPPERHLFVADVEGALRGLGGSCRNCGQALDRVPPNPAVDRWHSGPPGWITANPGGQFMAGSLEPLDAATWLAGVAWKE